MCRLTIIDAGERTVTSACTAFSVCCIIPYLSRDCSVILCDPIFCIQVVALMHNSFADKISGYELVVHVVRRPMAQGRDEA